MTNRFWYPVYFTTAYLSLWVGLLWYGRENIWIDRLIVGGIALCALFAAVAMSVATHRWTVRGLGIWGMMAAIVLSYGASLLVEFNVWELPPPYWIRALWRAMLAVAGPCMLYGYWLWLRMEDTGDD